VKLIELTGRPMRFDEYHSPTSTTPAVLPRRTPPAEPIPAQPDPAPADLTRHSRRGLRVAWTLVPIGVVLVVLATAGVITLVTRGGPGNAPLLGASGASPAGAGPSSGGPSTSASASPSAVAGPSATAPPAGSAAGSGSGSGACAFPVSGGVCPIAPPIAAAAGKKWSMSFDEEFSGSSLDTSKLSPCFDWNSGDCTSSFNHGREHYQSSQVSVSGGTAKLTAAPLSPAYSSSACQNSSCTYKAGLLSTARPTSSSPSYLFSFKYGYVESRFKFPATQGFFTAFWMLPADPSYNYPYEIDILELLGDDPTTMFMTYHYPPDRNSDYPVNSGKFNNGKCAVKDYSKDFVRMGMDWEPDHVAWYINGVECGRFTGTAAQIANTPMQLILHMMVDNDWQRSWNVGLQDPTLSRALEVDYIRVYQQK
jgi:beta-glucanase (GH16 family)